MAVSAATIIGRAFALLNVFIPGEAPPANDGSYALAELNAMMGTWAQERGTIPVVAREIFDLVANQGGPSNPYTIGDGGDFDTDRPPNQGSLRGASLLLTTSAPAVEVPLAVLNDDQWQSIQVKDLSNTQPTTVYYNATYAGNLGTINLWPVPTTAVNDLVLYLEKQISGFASQLATYDFPPGYEQALVYNLADLLQTAYGRELSAAALRVAQRSLALVKRTNHQPYDLAQNLVFGDSGTVNGGAGYGYNINTGNM